MDETTYQWELSSTQSYNNETECNETISECLEVKNPQLQLAYDILIPTILAIIMLSMGAGITLQELKQHLKPPLAPIMGLISQFIVTPAVSFGLAHALRLQPNHAIGMLIVASCPGGTVSNIFTLWSRGDLPLSVLMTAISTVLALGFMPLNLFIYLRSWSSDQARIPFGNIAIIVALTWVPVVIGVVIKHKAPKAAPYITRVGSIMGMAIILIAGVLQRQLYPETFGLGWRVWVAAFLQPLVGYGLGMALGAMSKQNVKSMRTMAYETGMQNVGLALTIIGVSYSALERNRLSQYPLLYAIAQMVVGIGAVIIHRIVFAAIDKKRKKYTLQEKVPEVDSHGSQKLKLHEANLNGNLKTAQFQVNSKA